MTITPKNIKKERIIFPDATTVAQEACNFIKKAAIEAIKAKGVFRIVLAGGTTPENIYKMLAKESFDWSQWEFYLGDERCLPVSSPDRNSQMALEAWLNVAEVPKENIYFIPSELGAKDGAKKYAETIINKMPFDMVLLGMGEDGHTASLFPGQIHDENEITHAVYNSPKPPSDRITLSQDSLSNSEQVLIIITGAGKRVIMEAWDKGDELPVTKISAIKSLTILLDKDASPK